MLVTPKLFSQIVNSNLEVRTSVSIDPETGAAAQGALFTYEAIPRTTWLWSDVIEDDYRKNNGSNPFPIKKQYNSQTNIENDGAELPDKERWERPLDVVNAGMRLIEYLGIGGMGTRGFGRMRLVAPRKAQQWRYTMREVKNLDLLAARTAQAIITDTSKQRAAEVDTLYYQSPWRTAERMVSTLDCYTSTHVPTTDKPIAGQTRLKLLYLISELGLPKPVQTDASTALKFLTDNVCNDLNRLLLVKQLWEQTLIYARYGAKARSAAEETTP